jgi:glycosyltransferase involved in cell wall biosynthesis
MAAAMSVFMSRHPDVFWYLHTEASGIANGVRIDRLLSAMRVPLDRVRIVPQYEYRMGIDHRVVADITRAGDVSLLTSRGEGFGLPLLESAAVGVPGIGTRWTAQEELIGPGWAIDGQLEWDEFQGSFWKVPNIEAIVSALEESYAEKGTEKAKERSAAAVAHAAPYETRKVFQEYWVPILAKVGDELRKTPNAQGPNRAARRASR